LHRWWVVSDRILVARFVGTISLTVVVAYAPVSGPRDGRAEFFSRLQRELQRMPGLDFQLVLGDFNSVVGSAAAAGGGGVLGRHGLGVRNAAGEELVQFCERNRLSVANTFFRHRAARKATWRHPAAPAGVGSSPAAGLACLDYVLVKRQWLSSVRDVRVYRSANLPRAERARFSDHQLLACDLRLKLKPALRRGPRPAMPDRRALAEEEELRARVREAGRECAAATVAAVAAGPAAGTTALAPGPAAVAAVEVAAAAAAARGEGLRCLRACVAMAAVRAVATDVLPPLVAAPRQPFVSPATLRLAADRGAVRRELADCTEPGQRALLAATVKKLAHAIARSRKRDKSRAAHRLATRLAELAERGNSHGFYAEVKAVSGQRAAPLPLLNGARGFTPADAAACFATHFEAAAAVHGGGRAVADDTLRSLTAPPPAQPGPGPAEQPWRLPTFADTREAVVALKHWRAADPSGMWAELLQAACEEDEFMQLIHGDLLDALQHGMPAVVKQSVLLPFFKKGDAADPGNYRGIQLISLLRKIIALVLARDLCRRLGPGLLEYQCGFRPQRSCADQLFTLRKLSELSVEWQQRLYIAFIDLAKAFDSIPRPALWAVLRARGVPDGLVRCLEDLHTGTTCRVRVGSAHSREFNMEYGVQQGCPLAAILFNVYFDHVVSEALAACPGVGVTVRRRLSMGADVLQPPPAAAVEDITVPVLLLADDLAFVTPSAPRLQEFVAAFESACQRWGLVISASKSKVMLVGGAAALACEGCQRQRPEGDMIVCDVCQRAWHKGCLRPPLPTVPAGGWRCPSCVLRGEGQDVWRPPILVGGQPLAWVDSFKYLGSYFTGSGSLEVELGHRIRLAAHAFRRLERVVFRQRCIPLRVRVQVYNSMVASVLLYGSESWALTSAQLQRLEVFHMCRLRMILGGAARRRSPNGEWWSVSNAELLARCGSVSVTTLLARRQLRWLGHLGRMGDERLAKQMLYATMHCPGRSRRLGRPSRNLCTMYADTVAAHMTPAALRRRLGHEVPRGSTWLSLCQNRDSYRALCP
jgi:hypothetical protein